MEPDDLAASLIDRIDDDDMLVVIYDLHKADTEEARFVLERSLGSFDAADSSQPLGPRRTPMTASLISPSAPYQHPTWSI